jgi:hypothetical protein
MSNPSEVQLPPVELLNEKFTYAPETGEFHWKARPRQDFATYNAYSTWNSRFAGKVAGWELNGARGKRYICLTLDYNKFLAHRAAWKMMTGKDPISKIDHEDGNGLNNKWDNLREATQSQQHQNKKIKSDNQTGYKNVRRLPHGRYAAYIKVDGKFKHLGVYDTPQEAHEVYCTVAKELHGEFFNPG